MVGRFNGRIGSEGLRLNICPDRGQKQLLHGFNQACITRRQRVLDGRTPSMIVDDHLTAKPELAHPAPHGRAGPCHATKARLIAQIATEVLQPDS